MDKHMAIVIAGAQGREIRDLAIKPGTTARDVLKSLGLDRYAISKGDGRLFGPRDNLYEAVEDGEKLYATTEAEVGHLPDLRLLLARVRAWWGRLREAEKMSKVTLEGTRPLGLIQIAVTRSHDQVMSAEQPKRTVTEAQTSPSSSGTSRRLVVEPQRCAGAVPVRREPTAYWQDKGWVESGEIYTGYFGTNGQRWPGMIVWGRGGLRNCYLSDPPRQLWGSPHAACFSYMGEGQNAVHFRRRPRTVDAAIMAVEGILSQVTARRS